MCFIIAESVNEYLFHGSSWSRIDNFASSSRCMYIALHFDTPCIHSIPCIHRYHCLWYHFLWYQSLWYQSSSHASTCCLFNLSIWDSIVGSNDNLELAMSSNNIAGLIFFVKQSTTIKKVSIHLMAFSAISSGSRSSRFVPSVFSHRICF